MIYKRITNHCLFTLYLVTHEPKHGWVRYPLSAAQQSHI